MNGNMAEISLKALSNESLLDTYYEYRKQKERYEFLTERFHDGYYEEKNKTTLEYYEQIKLEILSRMFGMEID